MQLYERCREARKRVSLSQEAMALELGVSRSAVAQWEIEQGTQPSTENLIALARRTGVAFEWLATNRGPMVFGDPLPADQDPAGGLSPDERKVIAAMRAMSPKRRSALMELIDAD